MDFGQQTTTITGIADLQMLNTTVLVSYHMRASTFQANSVSTVLKEFIYLDCISFLLLHNKLTQTQRL